MALLNPSIQIARYPRLMASAHYDPEVDIALLVLESGPAVSEERDWGLIDRDPDDAHLMGFEIWEASTNLPPELVAALPTAADRPSAA
jgi:uncharacterized protein YuzE